MPFHPDDGSAFFQLAHTVILQANLSLNLQIEEPARMLGHYNRVEQLTHILIRLQRTYAPDSAALLEWINVSRETIRRIIERLEQLHEYAYDIGDDDAVLYYPIIP